MRRLVAALSLLALGAGGACSSLQSSPPLVVGVIYPLSGSQGMGGHEELAGFQAALRVARDRGLTHARDVQLRIIDVQTPEGAERAVDRLIDEDHVQVIAGTYGSSLSEAAAARADRRHVVFWETGAVADGVTEGKTWVFRTVATGANLGRQAVLFAANVLGRGSAGGRAVIVALDDAYGRSVADEESRSAAAMGIQVVERIDYSPYRFDASAIAGRVLAQHPDYLFDVSYIDDGIQVWDAVRATGATFRGVLGTSSAFCMPEFGRREGAGAVGLFAADKPDEDINPGALSPGGRALLAAARSTYRAANRGAAMSIPAVAGFVGGWALFAGVLSGLPGPVTASALREAALRLDVPEGDAINGGGVHFAPAGSPRQGQNERAAAVVGQWQGVGDMRVVFPAGFATAAVQPPFPATR